jgi:hypothetical protein
VSSPAPEGLLDGGIGITPSLGTIGGLGLEEDVNRSSEGTESE